MPELRLQHVRVQYGAGRRSLLAVDDVSLTIPAGYAVGLVGESGSGKSTLARAIVGLAPVSSGRILLDSQDVTNRRDRLRSRLGRHVQMVFQSPDTALNPRMRVDETLSEALTAYRPMSRSGRDKEIARLLDLVALDSRVRDSWPRELSGGQRQRVAIARALAVRPDILIADEVTSALDVSVQGAVLNLLHDLRRGLGISLLFITHNLPLVRYVCDEIAVMYSGRIVETGTTEAVLSRPAHPYTGVLVSAAPSIEPLSAGFIDAAFLGEPPDPHAPPAGCRFHTRCPIGPLTHAARTECATRDPSVDAGSRRHQAACHFAQS